MKRGLSLCLVAGVFFMAPLAVAQNAPVRLTLQDAESQALKNHPQILAAQAEASAVGQEITEARAAYYPVVNGDLTGSQGNIDARIGAGSLSSSRLFNKFGQGITLNQLITDLGRTRNLVASSKLQAQASNQTYQATRYDVLLGVNSAYFGALEAQAVVKVAEQTVAARQLMSDQVGALARNQLKSQLDVSFADVNLADAKLLLIRSQDSVQQAFAELARAMGSEQPPNYQLVEEAQPPSPPANPDALIAQALNTRPEVASLRFARDAANRFYQAEKDLSRPTVSMLGVAGFLPLINQIGATITPPEYEGAAVNIQIPVFNGHLFSARREAARYRLQAADQRLRDQQEIVTRDVRVAWASAMTAYQRLDVSAQFLRQATLALDLAQGRYNLGLSSIVELTQGQLNETRAEIENLSAKYDYQSRYAQLQYALGQLR